MPRAVVLLSGGLDSATTLAVARSEGYEVYALSVDYGQRHRRELDCAATQAKLQRAKEHRVVRLDLRAVGGSALTDDISVPKDRSQEAIGHGVPVTYVPARNTVLLALCLGYAEVAGAFDLFIGANAIDYSVGGDSRIWVRGSSGARLIRIRDLWELPPDRYQTMAVDRETLRVVWRPVTHVWRHRSLGKRCYRIHLERGQYVTVTEDHSLFTLEPETARIKTIRGADVTVGTPLVVPFDLSSAAGPWKDDLTTVDLSGLPEAIAGRFHRPSIHRVGEAITNRLGTPYVPVRFPVTDQLLYVVGLWLAEGGKDPESRNSALAFSVGGIPGAVDSLADYFRTYGVRVRRSPANSFDYSVCSSVFSALFWYFGLYGTAKAGGKRFPTFFWQLSQRQRRIILAGLWDGDGSHVFKGTVTLAQKSHALIEEAYHCLTLDGIFPKLKDGRHGQRMLLLHRADDLARFTALYPMRHPTKRDGYAALAAKRGRDQSTGLWKCPGVWREVSAATLAAGVKTRVYNAGGKYDVSFRSRRTAFAPVPALRPLVDSRLAFLRVTAIEDTNEEFVYDLSVEGAENFVANGVLAHNSGYPDCRPEFLQAFERLANLATRAATEGQGTYRVHAPLVSLSKADIVRLGTKLGVDYGQTLSCYDPDEAGRSCGRCDSCQLRKKGFAEAGLNDPIEYRND